MGEALALLGFSVASALMPLFNLELYLIALSKIASDDSFWFLAAVAGLGQLIGKLVWYYLGANALRWGWVRKKVETPKAQAKLQLWQRRTQERPLLGALLLVVSGFSGFPPFAIVAVLAGQLRMNLVVFVVGTMVSRTLRFAIFLYAGDKAFDLLPSLGF
jgi:membrane protein YqaA with SNARE-associated domain